MPRAILPGAMLCGAVLLMAAAGTSACATGTPIEDDGGEGGGGAGGPNSPLPGYSYRQAITVTDGATGDAAVAVTFDHAQLVVDSKAAASGQDVRVAFHAADGAVIEIDRVVDPFSAWNQADTQIWFRLQAPADAGGSYYLYYGSATASGPPADGTAVYDLWDDFEDGDVDPAWAFAGTMGVTGSVSEVDGALRVAATAQDFGGTSDQIGMALRDWSGDFRLECELKGVGGSLGALSKAGGLLVRQSEADDAPHVTIAIQQTPTKRVRLFRPSAGASTDTLDVDAPAEFPHFLRLDRTGSNASAAYLDLSGAWLQLGQINSFTSLTDPVKIGIPLSNNSGGDGFADIEWIRVSRVLNPAPTAALSGAEQMY